MSLSERSAFITPLEAAAGYPHFLITITNYPQLVQCAQQYQPPTWVRSSIDLLDGVVCIFFVVAASRTDVSRRPAHTRCSGSLRLGEFGWTWAVVIQYGQVWIARNHPRISPANPTTTADPSVLWYVNHGVTSVTDLEPVPFCWFVVCHCENRWISDQIAS